MDTLFFWASKLLWFIVRPDSLLVVWLFLSVLFLYLGKIVWAKYASNSLLLVVLVIGLFPVGEWLYYPLETQYPANPALGQVDGIIALSGNLNSEASVIWDQVISGGAAERNFAFMALARQYPDAKLVYTGGSSSLIQQNYKAADVAQRLFAEQGLDLSRITFEREARNTAEHPTRVMDLIQPKPDEQWVLITTGWHMPRAMGVFCNAGWDVIPYPVDFQSKPGQLLHTDWELADHLEDLNCAIKEWIGLIAYKLLGRSC